MTTTSEKEFIVSLELTPRLIEDKTVERFDFNANLNQGFLKLNGVHNEIPLIVFPITLDKYTHEVKNEDIESLEKRLEEEYNVESYDITSIVEVFYIANNNKKILQTVKEYQIWKFLQQEQQQEEESQQQQEYDTVSTTLRMHDGIAKPKGTIIGMSKIYKAISKVSFYCDHCYQVVEKELEPPVFSIRSVDKRCNNCNRLSKNSVDPEHKNVVRIELQDSESFSDMDRLPVFLFDENTEGIRMGEMVTISGTVRIKDDGKLMHSCLYGESIKYLNREDFTLTEMDKDAIQRFVRITGAKNKTVDKLVEMFDPSIIGYEHVKKGLFMSEVNTSETASIKEKIPCLLIGDPGNAKSALVKRSTELLPGSNYISAQNSSGKSLTAIIDKAEDNLILRLGPVPQAKDAISGLNELGRTSMEDQSHLLDVMQEEEFTKTSYGFHTRIKSPVTIIASANPLGSSTWKDDDKIDLNEFPILRPLLDRIDLKFIFRDRTDPNEIREFAKKYSEMLYKKEKGLLPDYTTFLIKYIKYARQLKPELTDEARIMLQDFYVNIKIKGYGSDRVLITLHKLIKAIARLKLKEEADEDDAKEVMEFYNVMLLNFQKQVVVSQSLKDIAYNECITVLKDIKDVSNGITLEDLVEIICKRNEQLAHYFGYGKISLQIKHNRKTRNLLDLLLNNSKVKKVGDKPIVLQWLSDLSDASDSVKGIQLKKDGHIYLKSDQQERHIGHIGHLEQEQEQEEE